MRSTKKRKNGIASDPHSYGDELEQRLQSNSEIPMTDRVYNVLFLCTGNSARSILAEAIINKLGKGNFRGFSAGSHPKGQVHPLALDVLRHLGFPTEGLHSKSWDEFATPNPLHLDFVFTVCDNAAGEVCPYWPGQPMTAHWGIPDPAAVEGSDMDKSLAFREAFRSMETRIKLFLSLPLASIDRMRLKERLDAIGRTPTPTDDAR
jgi:protein-tyrosine-phosphatase